MSNKYPLTNHSHTHTHKKYSNSIHIITRCSSVNPLYPLRRYRWFKTRIEIWGPRLGSVEALAGLRVRFLRISSFDRLKNSQYQPRYQLMLKMLLFINWPPCLFLLRRQTFGGRFFLWTIRTSPDVTSLLRKIFTACFLCAPIIPAVLDPSFIRILRGFHFQVHFQAFVSWTFFFLSIFCPWQLTSVDSDPGWRFQSYWRFWVI